MKASHATRASLHNLITRLQTQPQIPPRRPQHARGNLPPQLGSAYIARGDEADIQRRLTQARAPVAIVGVHGFGGVGKTELAKQVCRTLSQTPQFDRIWWIECGKNTCDDILRQQLATLANVQAQNEDNLDALYAKIGRALSEQPTLLVLDDVTEANQALAARLPPNPPGACLITTRLLNLNAISPNQRVPLDTFTPEQAHDFLLSALGPERLQAEPQAAQDLLNLCSFHPLALELAVRRIADLQVRQPMAHFCDKLRAARLPNLCVGLSDERLNLERVLQVSFDALDSSEAQHAFLRLSVFHPSGFSLNAAAALNVPESTVNKLLHFFLLRPAFSETHQRTGFHDLMHEFATQRLNAQPQEADAAHRAAAEWLLQEFEAHFTDDLTNAPHLGEEINNLQTLTNWAAAQADGDLLARLATTPRNWLYNVFRLPAWGWLQTALQLGISQDWLRANVLYRMGDVLQFRKEMDGALEHYRQTLHLYRSIGAQLGEANVLIGLATLEKLNQNFATARQQSHLR